jgi:GNAT superfamily N-acetyltransferase
MADAVALRRLVPADLGAYKLLRDEVLAAHEAAFTSDAAAEATKTPDRYAARLGLDRPEGGHFTLGAFVAGLLVGAVSCERDPRVKVRHIGHLQGMMVRTTAQRQGVGRRLLEHCITEARRADGLERLTLSVTAGNPAERLYASVGFVPYGTLHNAIKLGDTYFDKTLMSLDL